MSLFLIHVVEIQRVLLHHVPVWFLFLCVREVVFEVVFNGTVVGSVEEVVS